MAVQILGVPTAAGAYGGGVMRGPSAMREAGLARLLGQTGLVVTDHGDLAARPFATDPTSPRRQNLDRVVEVAREVADHVDTIVKAGGVPFVLGGDCTITLGVVSGVVRSRPGVALAYVDGDADLSTPATTRSGILDAMGVATMLDLDGSPQDLAGLAGRRPMLPADHLALIGYDDAELDDEARELLRVTSVRHVPGTAVAEDPPAAVRHTLDALAAHDGLIVHFDVDVVDSTELPLGQFPHFNQGLTFEAAMEALSTACSAPDVVAIVITETNPENDPDGIHVPRLVEGLVKSLALLAG